VLQTGSLNCRELVLIDAEATGPRSRYFYWDFYPCLVDGYVSVCLHLRVSLCTFTHVLQCVQTSISYTNTWHTALRLFLIASFYHNHLFKGCISKYGNNLLYSGWGNNSITNTDYTFLNFTRHVFLVNFSTLFGTFFLSVFFYCSHFSGCDMLSLVLSCVSLVTNEHLFNAYYPLACLLWWNVYSDLLLIL
jgi:hypothetical protein